MPGLALLGVVLVALMVPLAYWLETAHHADRYRLDRVLTERLSRSSDSEES